MGLNEIILPHKTGFAFGVGVDRLSGTTMNTVVNGTPTTLTFSEGSTQTFKVTRISSSSNLQNKLGIDIEASYGCASFGAGASARFNYMKDRQVQSTSLFLAVTATVHLADLSIDHCVLTEEAGKMVAQPDIFTERYGNMFLRGCKRGGIFVGVIQVDTNSEELSNKIEAELKGSYGLFNADIQAKFQNVIKRSNASVYCDIYSEGGPPIQLTKPDDPGELLLLANVWLKDLQEKPNQYSVPYQWLLSPISIAEGPLPLNVLEIQHVQDILKFCARQRTSLLDQLNLFTYIYDNQSKFKWQEAVPVEEIRKAAVVTQKDLDTIADCASAAINDPRNAKMPAEYSEASNPRREYPLAFIPSPLPEPLLGVMVEVPDVIGVHPPAAYRIIRDAGLNPLESMIVKSNIEFPSDIIKTDPEPNKEVPKGSNVVCYWEAPLTDYPTCARCP